MYTRNDYLDGKCTHREYYAQFVTEEVRQRVTQRIGKSRIVASEDEHFNDISLVHWDRVGPFWSAIHERVKEAGDYMTMAGIVCIAKEAARQIVEGKES